MRGLRGGREDGSFGARGGEPVVKTPAQELAAWLHENPSRCVVINGSPSQQDQATFTLLTDIPDGRKVMSSVKIHTELWHEPVAGEHIVEQAKLAIANLMSRDGASR